MAISSLLFSVGYKNYRWNPVRRFFRSGMKKISSTVMVPYLRRSSASNFSENYFCLQHVARAAIKTRRPNHCLTDSDRAILWLPLLCGGNAVGRSFCRRAGVIVILARDDLLGCGFGTAIYLNTRKRWSLSPRLRMELAGG